MCDEIAGWINAVTRPVDLSDEAFALDLVDELGVGGSFLETDHTLTHYRDRWYPTLIDRRSFGQWSSAGSTTLAQRAAVRVEELLGRDRPAILGPEVEMAVRAIVDRAGTAASR
jgi:trimethylamine--corrinoid protein Co-methyltransferase